MQMKMFTSVLFAAAAAAAIGCAGVHGPMLGEDAGVGEDASACYFDEALCAWIENRARELDPDCIAECRPVDEACAVDLPVANNCRTFNEILDRCCL